MNKSKKKEQVSSYNKAAKKKRQSLPLTKKEIEIIKLIYQEKSSREIAEKLERSVRTIENHRNDIMQKLGCKNVVGIVKYVLKNKIVK